MTSIKKPNDYAEVQVGGDYRTLPADGYKCQILKAEIKDNRKGNPMIVLALEICEGDYAGFFQDKWQKKKNSSDKPNEVKYPNDGIIYTNIYDAEGNTSRNFKGLCTSLEEGGVTVWDDKDVLQIQNFKNAKVGVLFRREENEWNGKTFWQTKPCSFRSIATIESGDFKVPDEKPLVKSAFPLPSVEDISTVDSFSAAEDDIPF